MRWDNYMIFMVYVHLNNNNKSTLSIKIQIHNAVKLEMTWY